MQNTLYYSDNLELNLQACKANKRAQRLKKDEGKQGELGGI